MKTFMNNKEKHTPIWHVLDASGRPLGRVAAEAATILRGKHTAKYTPNADTGDSVVIINCKDAVLTGNKLNQKEYIRHTGWIGGLKRVKYEDLMQNRPEFAMMLAVRGMLPHTSLGRKQLTRLRVYADAAHEQEAQVAESAKLIKTVKAGSVTLGDTKAAAKPAAKEAAPKAAAEKPAANATTAAKAPAKKPAAKATTAAKKPAAKKPATGAAKKPAAKTAAKKPATKKEAEA
jgi:large subunit ribosomal protein L13